MEAPWDRTYCQYAHPLDCITACRAQERGHKYIITCLLCGTLRSSQHRTYLYRDTAQFGEAHIWADILAVTPADMQF